MKKLLKDVWGKLHREKGEWRLSHVLLIFLLGVFLGCTSGCSQLLVNKEKVKKGIVRSNFEVLLDDEIQKCLGQKPCLKKLEKRIQTPMVKCAKPKVRFVSCYDKKKGYVTSTYKKITLKVCE